jgi:hypothetical protein
LKFFYVKNYSHKFSLLSGIFFSKLGDASFYLVHTFRLYKSKEFFKLPTSAGSEHRFQGEREIGFQPEAVLQVEVKSGLQPEATSLRRTLTNQAESLILFQNEASPRFLKSLWNLRPEGAA